VDLVAEAHQIAGEPHDVHHLDRLDRLELRHPEVDPALRAVDAAAHAGDEHHQQGREAADQEQAVEALHGLELGAHDPGRQPRAHGDEQHAAVEEVVRPHAQLFADRDRAGGHHHDAERGQAHRGAEHPRIEAAADGIEADGLAGAVGGPVHQRTFNVARPTRTRITEMIQKRTITRGSGQPLSSKWWWMGAIRKTRFPVSLNDATWIITDSVSITKMPPMTTSTSSWRTITAMVPSTAPSASAPMSPMNTMAG